MRLAAILLAMLLRMLLPILFPILGPMLSPLRASTFSPPLAPRLSPLRAPVLLPMLLPMLGAMPKSVAMLSPLRASTLSPPLAPRLSSLLAPVLLPMLLPMLGAMPKSAAMLSPLLAPVLSSMSAPRLSSPLARRLSWILVAMRRRSQNIGSRRRGPRPPRAERVAHTPPDRSPCTQMLGREIWFRWPRARTVRSMRVPPRTPALQTDPVSGCRCLGCVFINPALWRGSMLVLPRKRPHCCGVAKTTRYATSGRYFLMQRHRLRSNFGLGLDKRRRRAWLERALILRKRNSAY